MGEVICVDFGNNRVKNGPHSSDSNQRVQRILSFSQNKIQSQIAELFGKSRADIKDISLDTENGVSFYIHGRFYKYCGCVEEGELTINPHLYMQEIIKYQQTHNDTFYYEDITLLYKEGNYIRFYTQQDPQVRVIYLEEENLEKPSFSL